MKRLRMGLAWTLRTLVRLAQGPGASNTEGMRAVRQQHARMWAQGVTRKAKVRANRRQSGALIREIQHRLARQVNRPDDGDLADAAALIVVELVRRRRARLV